MNPCRTHTPVPDRGAVSVEVTIAAPFMILLAMFLIFCGRAASAAIDINAAAAAGARAAADATGPAAAPTAAQDAVTATTSGTAWNCTTSTEAGALWRGGQVTVTVTCLVPLTDLGIPIGASRAVAASSTEPIDTFRAGGS
ncbi:MAG: pilus assembly protein [Micromonosporaceae bacterium]|nr:pilus assembly protein [Micromonosporaceae bacterium]